MKTIFVTVFDGTIATNLLRTEVFATVLKDPDVHLVMLVEPVRIAEYAKLFPGNRVVFEGVNIRPDSYLEKRWHSLLWHTVLTETLRIQLYGGPLSPHRSLLNRICTHALAAVFGNTIGRRLLRFLDSLFFRREPYAELFTKYDPSIIFATNVFAELDIELLREAKRRNIPTLGMVKSWDNVTSKGLIRQVPDKMIVHTERVRNEVVMYADMRSEQIVVCGVPQYDIYFRPDSSERIAFWTRFGIDGTKKVILYLEPGLKLAPRGHEIWQMLDMAIDDGKIKSKVDVFLSVHPAYAYRADIAEKLAHIRPVKFGYRLAANDLKTWELSNDAYKDVMRVVRYSDLVITTGSTMNIESSIFNKPIINIAFDGRESLPYHESVRQYYDYTHLLPIVRSGGVKIAYSFDDLVSDVNELLRHPEWGEEGRESIVKEQCLYTDGKSAERIGKAILAFLGENGR